MQMMMMGRTMTGSDDGEDEHDECDYYTTARTFYY